MKVTTLLMMMMMIWELSVLFVLLILKILFSFHVDIFVSVLAVVSQIYDIQVSL